MARTHDRQPRNARQGRHDEQVGVLPPPAADELPSETQDALPEPVAVPEAFTRDITQLAASELSDVELALEAERLGDPKARRQEKVDAFMAAQKQRDTQIRELDIAVRVATQEMNIASHICQGELERVRLIGIERAKRDRLAQLRA